MAFAIPFSQLNKTSISVAGGKGANLGELTAAGFSVPPGFVLTTHAYDKFVRMHRLQPRIVQAAQTVSIHDPQTSETASEKIQELILSFDIPKDIAHELLAAHAEFSESAVAVRSSATAEDLADASFAGQQETFLNVQGEQSLLDAVKNCWASLWTARAISYRMKQAISPNEVSLAVIVQKQIASDVSGVAFSLNPNNNCYDEAVINSSFGLGEAIVSGQVTPDNFVVDKVKHEILQKQVAHKDFVVCSKDGGGTESRNVDDPSTTSLTDAEVIAVAELTTRVEAHYDMPMDIEWAYADGKLYLLQARPITTYVPLPDRMITQPGAEKYLYLDAIVLTQGFQESLSVMGSEIWGRMVDEVKGKQGFSDHGMQGGVLNIDGRQYIHLSNLMIALGMWTAPRMMAAYDSPTRKIMESIDLNAYYPDKLPEPLSGLKWKVLRHTFSLLPALIYGLWNPSQAEINYEEIFAHDVTWSKQLAMQDIPFRELVAQLLARFGKQMETILSVVVPSMIARLRLSRLFQNDDVKDLLVALEMDLNGNPTSEMGHRMFDLAKFAEVQETETAEEFAQMIACSRLSAEFQKAFDDYMEKFGCRTIREIDIATGRSYENTEEFFKKLKAIDVQNDMLTKVAQRRSDAYDQLLALARQKGRESMFKSQAALLNNAGYREKPKYYFIVTLDLMRQRAISLGEKLVEHGRLDEASQVFNLTVDQLSDAQEDTSLDVRAIILKNLAPRERQTKVRNWPRVIDSRGRIFHATRTAVRENELVGDPIAPGVVKGIANVLNTPYEKPLRKGEILVTRATDPGWTPLFMNADGVVLEVGGALQHGAVIAREYGLPCVSGVDGAMKSIPDGSVIEVDGSNGIVRLLGPRQL